MKLKRLHLENFRQFYGTQTIAFADDDQRNVTIVFGANGAGKTTLLNAFTWTLYGLFSAGFEHPENLVNEKRRLEAKPGDMVSARVTIEFENEGVYYEAARVTTDRKLPDGSLERVRDGELSLLVRGDDGRTQPANNPEDRLNQILPQHLHAFFFFNGERIEALSRDAASKEIESGIKNLLGLEIVERSIRHLDNQVRKRLQTELHDVGSREMQEVIDHAEQVRGQIEQKQDEQRQTKENEEGWKLELDSVGQRLRGLEEAKHLQQQRETFEESLKDAQVAIQNLHNELGQLISKRGFLAFTNTICTRCEAVLREKREKGEIPTGIKQQFVQDLLERGECICGTHLKEGEAAFESVRGWLMKAGTNEVEDASIRAAGSVLAFEQHRAELNASLDTLLLKRQEQRDRVRRIEEQLSEIARKLSGKDSEEVRDLESRREQLLQKISLENRRFPGLAARDNGHIAPARCPRSPR